MKKMIERKLEDTSWLAQTIADKMAAEFDRNGASIKWNCLNVLHIVVNEADNPENSQIYYANSEYAREIIICDIPSMLTHGSDFDREGMQCKLRGLAERYKDDDGMYLVSVLTTHDLNSATVKNLSELMYQMGTK